MFGSAVDSGKKPSILKKAGEKLGAFLTGCLHQNSKNVSKREVRLTGDEQWELACWKGNQRKLQLRGIEIKKKGQAGQEGTDTKEGDRNRCFVL